MLSTTLVAVLALLQSGRAAPDTPGGGAPTPAEAAYARLAKLDGEWRGAAEWSGARTGGGPVTARYHLSGAGSAVVEDLEMESKVVMTSVYHRDGPDLRMTHYCAAQNQPRLKATRIDEREGRIHFAFVDANLSAPEAPHVDALDVELKSDREIVLTFRFLAGAKESLETIALTRVSKGGP
jgi:hypothetical protein